MGSDLNEGFPSVCLMYTEWNGRIVGLDSPIRLGTALTVSWFKYLGTIKHRRINVKYKFNKELKWGIDVSIAYR